MAQTIKDIIDIADRRKLGKEWHGALKVYRIILDAAPGDCEVRLNICDCFRALGFAEEARGAWVETCRHAARAGYPLVAIVAAKKAALAGTDPAELFGFIGSLYGEGSQVKGQTARISPIDRSLPVREGADLDYAAEPEQLVRSTLKHIVAAGQAAVYPETLPPLPILSDLPGEMFVRLLDQVRLVSLPPGEVVVREGEVATDFFMISKGRVSIYKGGGGGAHRTELASLGEGSIFGEMALITESPRSATVETIEETELLRFEKDRMEQLSQDYIIIEAAMERFTRERLISNLLATNPLFQPFDRKQRYELLSRFTAHEVTPGTVLVREGQVGRGLYILLFGEADVRKREADTDVLLATLKSGDVFGEISLIMDTPTTATVTALRHSTVLFLPKEYFQKLTEAIGNLKDYFAQLSEQRLSMTQEALKRARAMEDAQVALEDELIMI